MGFTTITYSRSSVFRNAIFLYMVQFTNLILPLVIFPYLVRVLNPSGFGLIAFAQSFIAFFLLIVDFGFMWSATRKISVKRDQPSELGFVVFNVWSSKALLCCIGFVILLILITIIPKLNDIYLLLLILYGTVVGNTLFPFWLFQGLEKMVYISVIKLPVQIIITICIFILVNQPNDYLIYAGIICFGSIIEGVFGAIVALLTFKLQITIPSWQGIKISLIEGWSMFLSIASISLYTRGNPFILGMLTNLTVVGYYSAAEKIVKVAVSFLSPISEAAYPRFSQIATQSKEKTLYWGRRMLILMSALGGLISILLFVGAPIIVRVILGSGYEPSIAVLRILAPLPTLIAVSNVLGVQLMFPFGLEKAVALIVIIAGVINLTLSGLLSPIYLAAGMAVAVLVSELFVSSSYLVSLSIRELSPLQKTNKLKKLNKS